MNINIPVSAIMTKDIVTVSLDHSLKDIFTIFKENDFHHLPVLHKGKLEGIISKEDVLQFLESDYFETTGETYSGIQLRTNTAKEVMTAKPLVLEPEDYVSLAADIFVAKQFRALPIVDSGELVGIVTIYDILACICNHCFADSI